MKHPAGCYRATQTGGVISSITTCAGSGSGETPHGVSGINLTVWGKARRRSTARTKPQHEPCWGFSTDVPRYETRQSARGARSASKQWDWAAASGPLPSAVSHTHIARDTLKASTPTIPGHNHNRALAGRRPTTKGSARRLAAPPAPIPRLRTTRPGDCSNLLQLRFSQWYNRRSAPWAFLGRAGTSGILCVNCGYTARPTCAILRGISLWASEPLGVGGNPLVAALAACCRHSSPVRTFAPSMKGAYHGGTDDCDCER
jgi:hypothetical protein